MRTVQKVTALLERLGEEGEVGVSDLARHIGADKGVVHRILQSLRRSEWVEQNSENRLYRIGPALAELLARMPSRTDVLAAATPVLDRLVEQLDETAFLSSRQGAFNVVEAIRESRKEVRVVSEVGRRIPLHSGAAGKVLLAFERVAIRDRLLEAELAAVTTSTITNADRLKSEVALIRQRGWGYDDGEATPGVCGLAVPVLIRGHNLVGCVSIRAPVQRLTSSVVDRAVPILLEAARQVVRELEAARG